MMALLPSLKAIRAAAAAPVCLATIYCKGKHRKKSQTSLSLSVFHRTQLKERNGERVKFFLLLNLLKLSPKRPHLSIHRNQRRHRHRGPRRCLQGCFCSPGESSEKKEKANLYYLFFSTASRKGNKRYCPNCSREKILRARPDEPWRR